MRENWLKGAPEFEAGWAYEMNIYRNQGFIAEPVTGRRRDFMDGENPNEISNFAIQSSAAGLMNKAILPLHSEIPLHKWGPGTGITNQCHDSIMIECPADKAEWVKGLLEECLNQTHPALPGVIFSASADIGHDWSKV
jgi:DNA polymerase I-like protein with 3'-5' exonuclease and polymerase domains